MAVKIFAVILVVTVPYSLEDWSGHYAERQRSYGDYEKYCAVHSPSGCSRHRYRWVTSYYTEGMCSPGWTHSGNRSCIIPVCSPECINGGRCVNPNTCDCPRTAAGPFCQYLSCSHLHPCYPGNCHDIDNCTCARGFKSYYRREGCLSSCGLAGLVHSALKVFGTGIRPKMFDDGVADMYPIICRSTASLANIRRTDNMVNFMYTLDGTNFSETETIWINQKRFNMLEFQFESLFIQPDNLPMRPNYVHNSGFGIVDNQITVNVSKVSRSHPGASSRTHDIWEHPKDKMLSVNFHVTLYSPIRDQGLVKTYQCNNGATDISPLSGVSNCTVTDDQFRILIEHGDWLNVKFETKSGGFRTLTDIDLQERQYSTDYYRGLRDKISVEFRFDFIAPLHCSEPGTFNSCQANSSMFEIKKEFTKTAIKPHWSGWTDDLSGLWMYSVEVFLLTPDPYGRLVEGQPLNPEFSDNVLHASVMNYPEYTPCKPGIYSVLLGVRDQANNTRTSRRFVIYDPISNISLNTGGSKLYVSSAHEANGYNWQTTVDDDGLATIVVDWSNHFANHIHDEGKFLNPILEYPVQFEALQSDGILSSKKFVEHDLDDYEGQLTRQGVTNIHGLVNFEIATVYSQDTNEPQTGWETIHLLAENYTFRDKLEDGQGIRIWVRGYDVMENRQVDSTYIRFDTSPPIMSSKNSTDTKIQVNFNHGTYNHTTRITFKASDPDSGVHEIRYSIIVHSPGKDDNLMYNGSEPANMVLADRFCSSLDGICYSPSQMLDLDNCWFMVPKEDLDDSSATISVTAYNRAMLHQTISFEIPDITVLNGLEKSDPETATSGRDRGPENFRVEKPTAEGFRIRWDLPSEVPCYGQTDLLLVIFYTENGSNKSETVKVSSSSKYFDILGRSPGTEYHVSLEMRVLGGATFSDGTSLAVRTAVPETASSGGISAGLVTGIAVGLIVIAVLVIFVFIILTRRGHFQPVRRGLTRARTAARRTFYGGRPESRVFSNNAYDKRASDGDELYLYGGMDISQPQRWHIARSDITFDSVIKEGHFVIYKATMRKRKTSNNTVVAKVLKEGCTEDDELLMKAKMNFAATVVGDHPNILKFIGAVVDDSEMGPMIIYEYCENGPLKEYLQSQKSNVTLAVHENLFKFGLAIAKGMEYLASKKIVHRRLAARNILLDFLNDVKITGFGPQPADCGDDDGNVETLKRERIPIKWMGPECMSSTKNATEKSDVWSYGVVLWEIFSLGATPYENIRSRELSGRIKKGERLPMPECCDDTWFGVMKRCWAHDPNKRPTFSDIRNQLDELFVAAPGEDYYYYKR